MGMMGIREIRVETRGIRVGIWGIGGGNEENQGKNLRIGVKMMNKNVERDKVMRSN